MYMPDYDGIQIISHFRNSSPDLPILAVSGHPKGNTLEIAKKLGVAEVLQKPFALDELLSAVNKALKR